LVLKGWIILCGAKDVAFLGIVDADASFLAPKFVGFAVGGVGEEQDGVGGELEFAGAVLLEFLEKLSRCLRVSLSVLRLRKPH
jgi:hypothetical protein